jgi:hypothetical protein
MTNPTTPIPSAQVSIDDHLPTSSPTPKGTLFGLAFTLGFIALFVLYYKTIGF